MNRLVLALAISLLAAFAWRRIARPRPRARRCISLHRTIAPKCTVRLPWSLD